MLRTLAPGAALLAASVAVGAWVLALETPAGSAAGKVADRDGKPQAGARIRFEDEDGTRHDTIAGPDGVFRLRLPAGSYRAAASAAGRSPAMVQRDFTVGPADPARLVFALGATESVATVKAFDQVAVDADKTERLAAIAVGGFAAFFAPGAEARGWAEVAGAEGDPVPFAKLRWKALAVSSGRAVPVAWGEAATGPDGRIPLQFRVPGGAAWARAIRLRFAGRDDQGAAIGAAYQMALAAPAQRAPGRTPLGLQVRLHAPHVARVGDRVAVSAEVRNDSPFPQKIDTTLTALGEERPAARPLTIPPGGRETLAWPVTATAAGQAVSWFNAAIPAFDLVASGSTTVLPAGRESGQAWTGEADRAGALEFAIPAGADRLSAAFTLQVALSPAEAAMASLEASDTSVVAAGSGLLAATRLPGIDRKVVAAYSRRLSDTQAADGAWAWWPGLPPDAAVTAFVMRSLAAAKESGFAVPEATWRRGLDRVLAPARIPGPDPAVLADAVWACGRDVPPRVLEAAWAERGRLGIAAQARLADGLARLGDGRALSVLAGLDLASREEAGLMHWEDAAEDTVARDWDRSAVEATAWVLEARLTAGSTDDDALRVARWLLRMRRGNGWASPRAGAVAALALLHPALRVPRSGPLALTFNNRPVSLTPARGAHWLIQDGLWPGRYLLTLSQPASGAAFTATLKFYEPAVPAAPRESPAIAIDRRYYAMAVSRLARAGGKPLSELLMPQALDRERPISATVPNDRLLVSRVTVKARQGLRFVRVSDAVPGGAVAMWAARRDDHRAWTSPDGAEVRFDVPEMRPGTYDFVHAMRPRVAGTYLSPGPIAAAVHAPDIRARGAAVRLDLSR